MEPFNIIEIKELDSTNNRLRQLLEKSELPEGFVIRAGFQNTGKGLGSNTWESEEGKNLTFSLLLRPTFLKAEEVFLLSKTVSLGIIDGLNHIKEGFTIKWPNDIYYQNKKLAGILIENQIMGSFLKHSILGIGININQEYFTSNAPNPVSLKQIIPRTFDLKECLDLILNQIAFWYNILSEGHYEQINQKYFSQLFRGNTYHDFKTPDEVFHAKIIGVNNDGCLLLRTISGDIRNYYMKEVEFVI